MNFLELNQRFRDLVYPSEPNDWDIEDSLQSLEVVDEATQKNLLGAVPVIWPISHSLCFTFLHEGAEHAQNIEGEDFAEWLRRVLYHYEKGGLKRARSFLAKGTEEIQREKEVDYRVRLGQKIARLRPFTRGISFRNMEIEKGHYAHTDTQTIFLPGKIDLFPQKEDNENVYIFYIGILTSFIALGSFSRKQFESDTGEGENDHHSPSFAQLSTNYFQSFSNINLAQCLYQLVECERGMNFLKREYPGLIRETINVRLGLYHYREKKGWREDNILEWLLQRIFLFDSHPQKKECDYSEINEVFQQVVAGEVVLKTLYDLVQGRIAECSFHFLPFMDHFHFDQIEKKREARIEKEKRRLEQMLADFISERQGADEGTDEQNNLNENNAQKRNGAKVILDERQEQGLQSMRYSSILIDNENHLLPKNIRDLLKSIETDLGSVPEGYVSAAVGLAGQGTMREGTNYRGGEVNSHFISYDEWDYRRNGYRKNWCGLRESILAKVKSSFVDSTLRKYMGELKIIRHQFELMLTQERIARARRNGDDIDLDALVEAYCDRAAGVSPSDKLFTRLIRNDRSISTMFLIDMSNSTEGWINTSIKETLILLCEAMNIVGDQYGIYGFSGMRRMRSEMYTIKELSEEYDETVKGRISAITPKEYTRMGPPVRHLTQKFKDVESKRRVLIIVSDGKPEDYDDYKGTYAVEDTKKAIAEAKGVGIQTFCIAIDRQSHEYLEPLFGRGNYVYIKDIRQLPSKMVEMYRLLTR